MKIGIISDTHDNVESIKKAAKVFSDKNVDLVIHCGDWCAPGTVKFFKGLKVYSILGNVDGAVLTLDKKLREMGGKLFGDFAKLELEGKKIAVYHGSYPEILDSLIKSKKFDIVLHGHTHKKRKEIVNETLVINPGSHYPEVSKDDQTVVILDLNNNEVEFVIL